MCGWVWCFWLINESLYFLSFFKAPAGIISSIESIFKKFFWGGGEDNRKLAWINWESICSPKEEGGLGVRRVGAFNLSLLGKWCWRMLVEKESLWYRVLKTQYGEEGGRLCECGRQSSMWWKTICKVREGVGEGVGNWFEENICRVVGDGRDTYFWYDTWLGDVPLRLKYPRLFDLTMDKECKVADMGRMGWTVDGQVWEWRRRLFAWENECVRECCVLLNNFVLQANVTDKWRWLLDPVNGYSVKALYRYITSTGHISDRSLVDDVWHKLIPSKVSVLVWRLLRNRLPTKDNLVHRGVLLSTNAACVGGCVDSESATHLFLHCNVFGSLWSLLRHSS